MSRIVVQSSGLLTTVQDLGRAGFGPLGVSPAGAADPIALRLGNLLVGNHEGAAAQALAIARDHRVAAFQGPEIAVRADTICIHGDTPGAPRIAEAVRRRLLEAGIVPRALKAADDPNRSSAPL